jgi:Tfp pilus assembly protein PilN
MSTINLLPDNYIKRRFRRRANIVCLGLFVIVMVGVVAAEVVSRRSSRHTEQINRRVQEEYEEAARLIEQMKQLQNEKQKLHAKALATASLMERVPRSTLLGVVTNALPKYASLTKFELETKELKHSSSSPRGRSRRTVSKRSKFAEVSQQRVPQRTPTVVTMRVTGLAATDVQVAGFIAKMNRNPLIKAADLVYSQQKVVDKEKPPLREFQVSIELKQGADAMDLRGEAGEAAAAEAQPPVPAAGV